MIPGVLHPVYPCALSILEQELPTHLLEVAALERILARADALEDGLHRVDDHVRLHVGRSCAELERPCHAQQIVDFARGVGVDWEWAGRGFGVHWDQLRLSATNDSYEGRRRQGEEGIGRDGGGQRAQVFLAVLADVSRLRWLWTMLRCTHTTEKVPDEDDQLPWRNMGRIVQLLERPTLALGVQYQQIAYTLKVLLCGM